MHAALSNKRAGFFNCLIAAMDSTRTISELKSAFIRAQVRILSESLELPEDWRNYAVETEEGELGEKVIEDVLHKGNFHCQACLGRGIEQTSNKTGL